MTEDATSRYTLADLMGKDGGTRDDAPAGPDLGPDFWDRAELVLPRPLKSVHIRIDEDVYDFFKAQGKGHLTRMSAVLRSYVEAQRQRQR